MKTLRFGIEIETVGLSRTKLAEAIHSVVGGTVSNDYRDVRITTASGRTWKVVPDGSLSGGENSGEIVSPVLGYDDIEELQNIIRAVRTAGAKADHSTGIHYARTVVMRSPSAKSGSDNQTSTRNCA